MARAMVVAAAKVWVLARASGRWYLVAVAEGETGYFTRRWGRTCPTHLSSSRVSRASCSRVTHVGLTADWYTVLKQVHGNAQLPPTQPPHPIRTS
eukprot:scaffold13153_cov103-Isochrysis_galbana.AAC.5